MELTTKRYTTLCSEGRRIPDFGLISDIRFAFEQADLIGADPAGDVIPR